MSDVVMNYEWPLLDNVAIINNIQLGAGIRTFTFNGTLAPSGGAVTLNGINRTISFTSAANLSAITFSISGRDSSGRDVTETLAGPNANTVYSTKYYNKISSIAVDIDMTGAVNIGTGTTGYTAWFLYDKTLPYPSLSISTKVTATINYTFQGTLYYFNLFNNEAIQTFDLITDMTGATTSKFDVITSPMYGCRIFVNSSNATGILVVNMLQQG